MAIARAVVIAALALAGCGRASAVELDTWSLVRPDGSAITIRVPSHFDDLVPRENSALHLRTRVELPPQLRGVPLSLALPIYVGKLTAFADGRACDRVGARASELAFMGGRVFRIPEGATADGIVDLDLIIDHRTAVDAWLDVAPRLSATPEGDPEAVFVLTWNRVTLVAGITALAAWLLVFVVIGAIDRTRRAERFWIVQNVAIIAFFLGAAGVFDALLGRAISFALAFLLAVTAFAALHFTHALFQLGRVHRVWSYLAAATVLCLAATWSPFELRPAFLALMAFNVSVSTYQLVRLGRFIWSTRERRGEAIAFAAAWLSVNVVPFSDNARMMGKPMPLGGASLAVVAYIFVGATTATLLAIEHVRAQRTVAERVVDLERGAREIRLLNEELRRQVAERSRELAEALAGTSTSSRSAAPLTEGALVDRRYRVLRTLGAGGMGKVYEVERLSDSRHFALKVLHSAGSGDLLARFAREAQIAASIDDPHLVPVVDVGFDGSGSLFLVMELIEGGSLEGQRARFGDLSFALPLLAQIARGIRTLHARGIVHRDLKPGNVLLDSRASARIADFGIAGFDHAIDPLAATKIDALSGGALTHTGALLGTPAYMAPELARGQRATPASDVFAFGVMAYELTMGRPAFVIPPLLEIAAGRAPVPPAPPDREGLPEAVPRAIARSLSIDPGQRPTAEELVAVFGGLPS